MIPQVAMLIQETVCGELKILAHQGGMQPISQM